MHQRIAVVGAYGSGKTTLTRALSSSTGLPRVHGSPMSHPVGALAVGISEWTPAQLVQLMVQRYTERVLAESSASLVGFVSDGSVAHEWALAKVRLVAGTHPTDASPLDGRERSATTALHEAVVDELGRLIMRHAANAYEVFLHVPIEFDLAPDNRPVNDNFRRISDAVLLPALAATGVPVVQLTGSPSERLRQAGAVLGLDTRRPIATSGSARA